MSAQSYFFPDSPLHFPLHCPSPHRQLQGDSYVSGPTGKVYHRPGGIFELIICHGEAHGNTKDAQYPQEVQDSEPCRTALFRCIAALQYSESCERKDNDAPKDPYEDRSAGGREHSAGPLDAKVRGADEGVGSVPFDASTRCGVAVAG